MVDSTLKALALLVLVGGALAAPLTAAEAFPIEITDADLRSLEPMPLADAARQVSQLSRSSEDSVWLAWRVESVARQGSICCYKSGCCDLDEDHGIYFGGEPEISREPVLVFLRFDDGEARRLRVIGSDCGVGLGGRPLHWLGDVGTEESLSLLRRWTERPESRLADEAVVAIAQHQGVAATEILDRIARDRSHGDLARDAIFWLGSARGRQGYERLDQLLSDRPGRQQMKAIIFALHESPVAESDERLVSLATTDEDGEVRQEALFWLGQSGSRYGDLIFDAVLTDPDPDVAKHAIFVLSQLPKPDNVERLAAVLTQDRRPALRKDALFWIGQSDTEDALEIVREILNP